MAQRFRSALTALGSLGRRGANSHPQPKPSEAELDVLGPQFGAALRSLYSGEPQLGLDGERHPLHRDTKISIAEGMFLYHLCRDTCAKRTMEIGCAYGFSTLYFLAALAAQPGATHTAIDPYESSAWSGIGRRKVEEVGGSGFRLAEEMSIVEIPQLFRARDRFDVIFIDGYHRFDDVLVDFTLSALVCEQGGHILFDDMWMPSIQKVASFVRSNRADFAEAPGVEGIAVFRKVADDHRNWNHFEDFR